MKLKAPRVKLPRLRGNRPRARGDTVENFIRQMREREELRATANQSAKDRWPTRRDPLPPMEEHDGRLLQIEVPGNLGVVTCEQTYLRRDPRYQQREEELAQAKKTGSMYPGSWTLIGGGENK